MRRIYSSRRTTRKCRRGTIGSCGETFTTRRYSARRSLGPTRCWSKRAWLIGRNGHKATKTVALDPETQTSHPIFHPRQQRRQEHFAWSEDHLRIIGLTPTGRATITLLHLNRA